MIDDRLQHAVRLSMAVYRVTDRFPEHEPLRSRLRDAALAVVVSTVQDEPESVAQAVHTLSALADLATPLGYVSPVNFGVLKQFYESFLRSRHDPAPLRLGGISKEVRQKPSSKKRVLEESRGSGAGVSRRRDRIVHILRKRGPAQLRELVSLLGGVSSRTVRRELNRLCQAGFVERRGFGASSFYRILA